LGAIRAIRAFDPKAQIVVCSALTDAKIVREALICGARDFMVKPFDERRVVEAIGRAAIAREKLMAKPGTIGAEITSRGPKPRV
jgi:response regulator of citrate/malate metabolism